MRQQDLSNAIIRNFKAGDTRSLEALFRLYYNPLCLFAERLVRNRQAAEDIVEESFLKLWSKHEDFNQVQNIKAFLYITTRNSCLNLLKQEQRDALSRQQLAYLSDQKEGFILNEMIRAEVLQKIQSEIEKLPDQCRKIFELCYLDGLKNFEIAQLLRISIHTVKNQKARAVQILKVKFGNRDLLH
jgi:RNA polymerase sigma-70 factor (ECF subfamily)